MYEKRKDVIEFQPTTNSLLFFGKMSSNSVRNLRIMLQTNKLQWLKHQSPTSLGKRNDKWNTTGTKWFVNEYRYESA